MIRAAAASPTAGTTGKLPNPQKNNATLLSVFKVDIKLMFAPEPTPTAALAKFAVFGGYHQAWTVLTIFGI